MEEAPPTSSRGLDTGGGGRATGGGGRSFSLCLSDLWCFCGLAVGRWPGPEGLLPGNKSLRSPGSENVGGGAASAAAIAAANTQSLSGAGSESESLSLPLEEPESLSSDDSDMTRPRESML